MASFGLITEGVTDQAVIRNILAGFFNSPDLPVRPIRPLGDATHRGQIESFSNWELVLEYCAGPEFEAAFQFADYLIVHIDTDKCDDQKFGVSKRDVGGNTLQPRDLVTKVVAKIRERVGERVWGLYGDRVIFAIAVDSIECWLLPLYFRDKKKGKFVNCLDTLKEGLAKKNLSHGKTYRQYDDLSHLYSIKRTLMARYQENPSLTIFVENLQKLGLQTQ